MAKYLKQAYGLPAISREDQWDPRFHLDQGTLEPLVPLLHLSSLEIRSNRCHLKYCGAFIKPYGKNNAWQCAHAGNTARLRYVIHPDHRIRTAGKQLDYRMLNLFQFSFRERRLMEPSVEERACSQPVHILQAEPNTTHK